jgi:hypothetical protein
MALKTTVFQVQSDWGKIMVLHKAIGGGRMSEGTKQWLFRERFLGGDIKHSQKLIYRAEYR